MKIVLYGDPRTKKNSQVLVGGKYPRLLPSKAYKEYEQACLWQIGGKYETIITPVNVKCVYHMKTRRKVDLVNLIEATLDILVKAYVLDDDNSGIAYSHDGSRVMYDKANPRVEIEITEVQDEGAMQGL